MRSTFSALALLAAACFAATAVGQEPAKPAAAVAPPQAPREDRAASQETLLRAYQKEYTFLATEEAALAMRLTEVEAGHTQRTSEAARELAGLEERLRALELDVESRRARFAKVDEGAAGDDPQDALVALLSQAATVVSGVASDADPNDPTARVTSVDRALGAVVVSLRDRGRVRRASGSFFLPSGAEAKGDLVWIGAVACMGASPQAAGALAPAGSGGLQLWNEERAEDVRSGAAGRLPEVLPLYVFESLDKPVERKADPTLAEYISRGGFVGWVIVGLGTVALCLVLSRIAILSWNASPPDPHLAAIEPMLAAGEKEKALAYLKRRRGSAARVLEAIVPRLGEGTERLESVASERMLKEVGRIERFETAILVTASVAPLLGLLGTVTGMISTFDVITMFGSGDPKLLAGGISEALVATALGLYVAIPSLLVGNVLATWTEGVRAGMERATLRMLLLEAGA